MTFTEFNDVANYNAKFHTNKDEKIEEKLLSNFSALIEPAIPNLTQEQKEALESFGVDFKSLNLENDIIRQK